MSWMQAAMERQDRDEVFDEEGDEMSLLQRDWSLSMEKRLKEGFREGIDAGKETSLQKGFNQGYKLGVKTLMPCGKLRGTISALLTWCQLNNPESEEMARLNNLLATVRRCEEHLVKCLSSSFQVPHPSELSSTMADMGLSSNDHGSESATQDSCMSGVDCCRDSHTASFDRCRTTQELNDLARHELDRILKETLSVAEAMGLPSDLLVQL
ncbi:protein YAE1 homolog [Discoglossus pictus]